MTLQMCRIPRYLASEFEMNVCRIFCMVKGETTEHILVVLKFLADLVLHMIIPIIPASDDGPAEWSLVEMQGNLLTDVPGGLGGLDVGAVTHNNGTPFLTIGPHILEGKVVKLVPPLLILERGDGTVVAEGAAVDGSIEYSVAGIAHTKFLFNERPKLGLKRL